MKAHRHYIPSHRLLKPDELPESKPVPPKLNYLWLRTHPGVRFADQPANQPRTSMEAAFRFIGL